VEQKRENGREEEVDGRSEAQTGGIVHKNDINSQKNRTAMRKWIGNRELQHN
jgi:hypothetical protein